MPGGTGIDLLKAVELQGIKTPVVLVTGVGDANLIDEAMDHGPITLIRKPIRVKQVRQVLEAAFSKRRSQTGEGLGTNH
jgi:two-component system response regulator (stage 0 sporulation protein F)